MSPRHEDIPVWALVLGSAVLDGILVRRPNIDDGR
jgi:hypothetical protein